MANILIAGGSGLVGQHLTTMLIAKGHSVSWLSRKASDNSDGVRVFAWNPFTHSMDPQALIDTDHIVSLAGSSIAGKAWSSQYKSEIIGSRKDAAASLISALDAHPHKVKSLVAASAVGYYGDRDQNICTEETSAGSGFLSTTTREWEEAYAASPLRTVLLRIGIVLSTKGGALPVMAAPLTTGVCPILGGGTQYMSWIHIEDLCQMFLTAMEKDAWEGVYNACGPAPCTHKEFMLTLRKQRCRYAVPVPVPGFALKLLMGEKSSIVTDSTRASAQKIQEAGFRFRFDILKQALTDLYERKI